MSPSSRPPFPEPILGDASVSLARVPVGWRRRIVSIDESARAELENEGVFPGAVVVVTARTPFGGPVVVELGRTRLALSAGVAALVATVPFATGSEPA